MKYIKILVSSLFVLVVFTACSQKDVKVAKVVKIHIDEISPLHSKIIAIEKSK